MNKENLAFRSALLLYLQNNDSSSNKNRLYKASQLLADCAQKDAGQKHKESIGADEASDSLGPFIDTKIKNIRISKSKLKKLEDFIDTEVVNKDKKAGSIGAGAALQETLNKLKEAEVSDEQDKVLSSIYAIELDSFRIRSKDAIAGNAALELSQNLLELSCKALDAGVNPEQVEIQKAFDNSNNKGINKHRGLKASIQNALIALSTLFLLPLIIHGYRAYKTGEFWSKPRTQTQEHIDEAKEKLTEHTKISNN